MTSFPSRNIPLKPAGPPETTDSTYPPYSQNGVQNNDNFPQNLASNRVNSQAPRTLLQDYYQHSKNQQPQYKQQSYLPPSQHQQQSQQQQSQQQQQQQQPQQHQQQHQSKPQKSLSKSKRSKRKKKSRKTRKTRGPNLNEDERKFMYKAMSEILPDSEKGWKLVAARLNNSGKIIQRRTAAGLRQRYQNIINTRRSNTAPPWEKDECARLQKLISEKQAGYRMAVLSDPPQEPSFASDEEENEFSEESEESEEEDEEQEGDTDDDEGEEQEEDEIVIEGDDETLNARENNHNYVQNNTNKRISHKRANPVSGDRTESAPINHSDYTYPNNIPLSSLPPVPDPGSMNYYAPRNVSSIVHNNNIHIHSPGNPSSAAQGLDFVEIPPAEYYASVSRHSVKKRRMNLASAVSNNNQRNYNNLRNTETVPAASNNSLPAALLTNMTEVSNSLAKGNTSKSIHGKMVEVMTGISQELNKPRTTGNNSNSGDTFQRDWMSLHLIELKERRADREALQKQLEMQQKQLEMQQKRFEAELEMRRREIERNKEEHKEFIAALLTKLTK
jgi:hypothetical protein